MPETEKSGQSAYLVIGGELQNLAEHKFANAEKIEFVGIFADYSAAKQAWKSRALETVDNALQRYCIIGLDSVLRQAESF